VEEARVSVRHLNAERLLGLERPQQQALAFTFVVLRDDN
jgi:hypothetical protein